MNRHTAIQQGGREWKTQDGKYHRVYFNDLAERAGLVCAYYDTGNVSSASLNGERISNSQARRLLSHYDGCKLWWDCQTERWGSKGLDADEQAELVATIERVNNDYEASN